MDATQRKIINKATGEEYPVLSTTFNTEDSSHPKVEFTTSIGVIVFDNTNMDGNLTNDEYTVEIIQNETENTEPINSSEEVAQEVVDSNN